MIESFKVEKGPFGLRATVTSGLVKAISQGLFDQGIADIVLNDAFGWTDDTISPLLEHAREIRRLELVASRIISVDGIDKLQNLTELHLSAPTCGSVIIEKFSNANSLSVDGSGGNIIFGPNKTIKKLYLYGFQSTPIGWLKMYPNIEYLILVSSNLSGIGEIEQLSVLKEFSVRGSIINLQHRLFAPKSLKKFEIQGTRAQTILDKINFEHASLNSVLLIDVGPIRTLEDIYQQLDLETLLFYGNTNVLDGKVAAIGRLKMIKNVTFANRKHYDCNREALWTIIEER